MLIVSKFLDYYDKVGAQYGVDKSIVYQRKLIENLTPGKKRDFPDMEFLTDKDAESIKEKLIGVFPHGHYGPGADDLNYPNVTNRKDEEHQWWIIGFCGKVYVVLEVSVPGYYDENHEYIYTHSIFIHYDQILKTLTEKSKEEVKSKNRRFSNDWIGTIHVLEKLMSLDFSKFFYDRKTPCFAWNLDGTHTNSTWMIVNPKLADFEFWKIKDPFTAFQEIQQYISGVLGTDINEPVVTEDKYKIIAAGFDLKSSFRKDPGKPKPRKSK